MLTHGEVDLEEVARLEDEAALAELCRLAGVGEKVANCALLFAFGRLRAFPIDVWIQRVLSAIYFRGKRKVTPKRLRDFSGTYFGPYSGYAQQYLFHHARKTWPRSRGKKFLGEKTHHAAGLKDGGNVGLMPSSVLQRADPFMFIDAVLHPAEIALLPQRDLSRTTCVVFDVLRATSTMVTGLAHGVAEIYPVKTIEEAQALKERFPAALLAGERHGDPIPGFDLGNSPFEYRDAPGRAIISTTTNGTIGLRACEGAQQVLVAALLNLQAIATALLDQQPENVVIVCSGTFQDLALGDVYAAGRLVQLLGSLEMSDAAKVARAVAACSPNAFPILQQAKNGRVLASNNRAAEVDWCAQESLFPVVGRMEAGVIRAVRA
jgi:phosphosulfolactate phosphohydrolase-like enzyme